MCQDSCEDINLSSSLCCFVSGVLPQSQAGPPKASFFSLSSRKEKKHKNKTKTSNCVVCVLQDVLTCLQTLSYKKRTFSFMAPRKGRNMNFCKTSGEIKEACTAQKKMPTLLWSPRLYQSKSLPPHTFLIFLCSNWVSGEKLGHNSPPLIHIPSSISRMCIREVSIITAAVTLLSGK